MTDGPGEPTGRSAADEAGPEDGPSQSAGGRPADSYPKPPIVFTDRKGREVRLAARSGDELEELVGMYRDYDPRDRAQGIPPTTVEGIRRWLGGLTGAYHVVALHEARPVGHAFLAPESADTAELAIFVARSYQNAGIGTRLMKALLGLGATRGVRRVWLLVQRSNAPAVRLYRKVGFETVRSARCELEMERELEPADGD